jgi:hypothetical protein
MREVMRVEGGEEPGMSHGRDRQAALPLAALDRQERVMPEGVKSRMREVKRRP